MPDVTRALARCGVPVLVLALSAGPGAALALAEPAHPAKKAATAHHATKKPTAAHHPAVKPARSQHRSKPVPHAADDALGFVAQVAAPNLLVTAEPALDLGTASPVSIVLMHPTKKAKPALSLLEVAGPTEVVGQAVLSAPSVVAAASRFAPAAAVFARTTALVPAMVPSAARPLAVRSTRPPTVRSTRASTLAPVGRSALPAQGPAAIGSPFTPSASRADVPLFVAVLGLMLVMAGARGVARLRRAGADEDLDLSWD